MQTHFTAEQLRDPQVRESDRILRACVHCGFCTATCPTYLLTGDELDGPRGRIYLAKDMLEKNRPADATTVKHLDRCLTCLSCMTTCPSGVNYMHLVDHARQHIERTYQRPFADRFLRWLLAFVMPSTTRFRIAMALARLAWPMRGMFPPRMRAMLEAARDAGGAGSPSATGASNGADRLRAPRDGASASVQGAATQPSPIRRVALLPGCVQPALRPEINAATVRLLNRFGVEVVVADGTGCCGSLVHHLGREHQSSSQAKADIDAWTRELEQRGLDAIIVTASGCGTMLKDYGFLFRNDPEYAEKAARISSLARDVSEVLAELLPRAAAAPGAPSPAAGNPAGAAASTLAAAPVAAPRAAGSSGGAAASPASAPVASALPAASAAVTSSVPSLRVAYHSACSLQHGQKLHGLPAQLLRNAGFTVLDVPEAHICCGSAGTYSLLQPEMSSKLRDRKAQNIESLKPDVIATGNIGCITQISQATGIPIIHTVELLDWATGGPRPPRLPESPLLPR